MVDKICAVCGRAFQVIDSRKNKAKYCSVECCDKSKKGRKTKPFSDEHRRKLSEARKGFKYTDEQKKAMGERRKGRTHSPETRKKMSLSRKQLPPEILYKKHSEETKKKMSEHKRKYSPRGENSSNWQGGKSLFNKSLRGSTKYIEWRKAIFERDDYTCQKCDKRGSYVEAHHEKEPLRKIVKRFLEKYRQLSPQKHRDKLLRLAYEYEDFWELDNGQTLCSACHNLTKPGEQRVCKKTKHSYKRCIKLSGYVVQLIRQMKKKHPALTQRYVAGLFDVSGSTINRIWNYKRRVLRYEC